MKHTEDGIEMYRTERIIRLEASNKELLEALNEMMDWALSNRGSQHEFVTCRTNADIHSPTLDKARAVIAASSPKEAMR